eukprot:scaffold33420_cov68-Phaeocystis_antarctica.AAC.7
MAVLVGGLRVLDAGSSSTGVLTDTPGQLSNDFFVNLLDMDTVWSASEATPYLYEGKDAHTGELSELKWKASQVDLSFGSNSQLRAIAEYYACDDAKGAFVDDFAAAWAKVMNVDCDEFGPLRPVSDEPSDLRAWRVPRGPRGSQGLEGSRRPPPQDGRPRAPQRAGTENLRVALEFVRDLYDVLACVRFFTPQRSKFEAVALERRSRYRP